MKIEEILALYDEEQRRTVAYPGLRREELSNLVRHVSEYDTSSVVLFSRLSADDVDKTIEEQISYFEGIGHDFEWKAFGHDTPSDLIERLEEHSFEIDEVEAIVVLDLEELPAVLAEPVRHDIRRIGMDGLGELIRVEEEVWGEDRGWLEESLRQEMEATPDLMSVYVAYADGVAAATGWIRFDPRGRWGSLWGGSTLSRFRKQGIYTALVALRAQEARERGVRFLTVDASPMSRPILEKLGFRLITTAQAANWTFRQPVVEAEV